MLTNGGGGGGGCGCGGGRGKAAAAGGACAIKEDGWAKALSRETSKPYFRQLERFLDAEYKSKVIYPPREKIFNAFESCPLSDVKVVILGQDPYHQPGQAHGLAFSVMKGVVQPPSLRNMVKEAVSCCGIRPTKAGTLDSWCGQGVLLLNTVLSVERSKAHSHKKRGRTFTDAVVREVNKGDRRVVFMLWGKPSQGPDPFIGSACFRKANEALAELGHPAVDWNVEAGAEGVGAGTHRLKRG
eukprot:jgi/Undpi1/5363/HiC_scaffold_2.g00644.m1